MTGMHHLFCKNIKNDQPNVRSAMSNPRKTSMIPRAAIAMGFCLAFATGSASANEVRIKDREGTIHEPNIVGSTSDVLEFEAALGDDSLEILLDEKPVKVERRRVYQLALSDEGAWTDVPGAETTGKPLALSSVPKWIERNDLEHERNLDFSWKPAWTDAVDKSLGEKWSELARRCAKGVGSDGSSCYIYEARRELRVWFASSPRPVILRLLFPGGC